MPSREAARSPSVSRATGSPFSSSNRSTKSIECWIGELADQIATGASLGDLVEQSIVTLEERSRTLVPWCEGP